MIDYLHRDVYGTWEQIKHHPIVSTTYPGFKKLNFLDTFFALNIQRHNPNKIPTDKFKKFVISYHTEYFDHSLMREFFKDNPNCSFIFINDSIVQNFWPSNVTTLRWVTWGQQLKVAVKHHSISTGLPEPKYKLSSLSNRHEFHKAAITAFLLERCNASDMILSWNNWCPDEPYYKSGMYIPKSIQHYLNGKFKTVDAIKLDKFKNLPLPNGNWQHPAYIDCAINITNESVFNSQAEVDNNCVDLPAPYLTEKTWKPLLASRPFIPVGQVNTLRALEELGFIFNYGLDLSFDSTIPDFERITKIYKCLEQIIETDVSKLYSQTKDSTTHNLEHIRSGNFNSQCNIANQETLEKISNW